MMSFSFCACDVLDSLTGESKKESSKKEKDDDEDEDEEEEDEEDEKDDEDEDKDAEKEDDKDAEKEEEEEKDEKPASSGKLTGLSVEKINTIKTDDSLYSAYGGLYYRDYDSNKYGLMTFDGKKDTGAIYTKCDYEKIYFSVSKQTLTNPDDIPAVNSRILVDAEGKQLIGPEYAMYEVINARFVQAYVVTQQTPHKAEAVVTMYKSEFDNKDLADQIYYKGVWYVVDVTTGQRVPGVTATNTYGVTANNKYIQFYDDAKNVVIVDTNGNKADRSGMYFFSDGSYRAEPNYGEGAVYDANDNKLFSYKEGDFRPSDLAGEGLYYASKYTDDGTKYVIVDKTGKVVSAEFDEYITVAGDFILCDKKVVDFDGKQIVDIKTENIYFDKYFGKAWCLKDDEEHTFITKDGTVIYQGEYEDEISIDSSNFIAYKKVDSDYMFYSYADKDYTIKGRSVGPWMVAVESSESTLDLVDLITGKKLIKDFAGYSCLALDDGTIYVYAQTKSGWETTGYEIYQVK